MKRNWYAVYTSPEREKKVATFLTKKGIKNYFPQNRIVGVNVNSKKENKVALFSSCVFVYITAPEIESIKGVPGMKNFLYWISSPAVISWEEIEAIKQLTSAYRNIKLEKSSVNLNDSIRIIDEPVISFNEKSASVKFQTLKIVLPSLGYTMIAERDKVIEEVPQEEMVKTSFFPKRLNSLFTN